MSERLTLAGIPVIKYESEGNRPLKFDLTYQNGQYSNKKAFIAWPTVKKGETSVANPVLDEVRKAAAEGTCVTVTYTEKPGQSYVNSKGITVNPTDRTVWEVVPGGTPGEQGAAPSRSQASAPSGFSLEDIKTIARQVAREEIASWGVKSELNAEVDEPKPDYNAFKASAEFEGFNGAGIQKRLDTFDWANGRKWTDLDNQELDVLAASLGFNWLVKDGSF